MENIGGNAMVIKELNINLVRKVLKAKDRATKQQIARVTGLSFVTVGTVLQHLINQNEVFTDELSPSGGGRPAKQYRYNSDFTLVLVLFPYEIGGNIFIRSSVVNLSGIPVYEEDIQTDDIDLASFERVIKPLLAAFPAVKAIGFGHPGVEVGGQIITSDYKSLTDTLFIEHFSNMFKVPVVLENDVNCAAVGFVKSKRLTGEGSLIYIYFPDRHPPGAGIFIDGKLLKGKRNFAGEISAIPLGIVWDQTLYNSSDALCEAATRLIVTVSSILNPERIILSGSFLDNLHVTNITQSCNAMLPKEIIPSILLSDDFIADYRCGLIIQTLDRVETDIVLTRKNYT